MSIFCELVNSSDDAAFTELYQRQYGPLFRLASGYLRRCGGVEEWTYEADDIVADVFAALWVHRGDLKLHASIDHYLRAAIHRSVLYQFRRRTHNGEPFTTATDSAGNDETVLAEERIAAIGAAVERLPSKCQCVFRLYTYEEFGYKEISLRLDISVRTVEAHLRRARSFLMTALPEEYWLAQWQRGMHEVGAANARVRA